MTVALTAVAVGSLALVVYAYAGYPLLLLLLDAVLPRRAPVRDDDATPPATLLISCFNEEAVLRDKLENALALDYPAGRLEILVVSDASDDGTDAIARAFADRGVRLVRQDERLGKTAALNRAVPEARGEILVFSDANAFYRPDAIRKLARNFADPRVGYVVGEARYADAADASGGNESSYWSFEMRIKRIESRLHSVVGGDGAIYAIRRELYEPLRADDINDFVNPLQIVARGWRGRYESEAVAIEDTAGSYAKEFRRKARIVNRSFSGLMRTAAAMNPFRTGLFSLLVVSHKLLRWIAPFFILAFVAAAVALSLGGRPLWTAVGLAAVAGYAAFYLGWLLQPVLQRAPLALFPYYFVMVNLASMRGVWNSVRGRVQATWQSPRAAQQGGRGGLAFGVAVHVVLALALAYAVRVLSAGTPG